MSLVAGLYGTLPIFIGGVLNTVAVSSLIAMRIPTTPFILWAAFEIALAALRLPALLKGRKAIAEGREGPTLFYFSLAILWAASVGYGTYISVASGDWVAASLACLSSAAMVGGICFRNFGAPRLVAVMIALSLGPCALAAIVSGQPILLIVALQIPFYLFSMTKAAYHLNRMLVKTMRAERENDHNARHDPMTQVLNRLGLEAWLRDKDAKNGAALFYIDLDGFKQVNDRLGHSAGDALLTAAARRLQAVAPPGAAVARLGGDEFVMVVDGCGPDQVTPLGMEMVDTLCGDGYRVGDQMVFVGASVGAAIYPQHGADLPALLGEADRALYAAKATGGWRCAVASDGTPLLTPKSVRGPSAMPPMPWQERPEAA
ncbi:GGDEF domain-containing protein [Sphingosinicella rhizophila]|uniref:GGDEF domain-containing protein n=1 Tax=Sphingosinicella rhizophila TaxID=3050082 RepID=A0ABU3QA68_9SPHN|nr:GGDEF domain-containing protein [Sphingosinicella sp. GR2756]MDT9600305.1 GGDEF domain-containing protein [Sphingosinicella sp. GR2756]